MNKNKKFFNWGVIVFVGIALLLLVVGSFVSPILIYLTLVGLGMLGMSNMIRINSIETRINLMEIMEEEPPIPLPKQEGTTREEPKQPKEDEIKMQKLADTLLDYVIRNYQKGFKLDAIREVMLKKYNYMLVNQLLDYFQKEIEPQLKTQEEEPLEDLDAKEEQKDETPNKAEPPIIQKKGGRPKKIR